MIKYSALSNLLKKAIENGIDTIFISNKSGDILCIEGNDIDPTFSDILSSMWVEYEPSEESPLKGEKLNYLLIENDDSNIIMTNIISKNTKNNQNKKTNTEINISKSKYKLNNTNIDKFNNNDIKPEKKK